MNGSFRTIKKDELEDFNIEQIKSIFQPGNTTYNNPLEEAIRLRKLGISMDVTFEKIKTQIIESFPKQLFTLYDV